MAQIAQADSHHQEHKYPAESAGRLMVTDIPTAHEFESIADVETMLLNQAGAFESINYIYVVDDHQKLLGVFSIKELYRSPKAKAVREIMQKKLLTVRAHTDQEHVALLALKHSIKAVPVVDKDGRFLGAVPSDTILRILNSESVEDALMLAGSGVLDDPAVNIIEAGAFVHFRKRLPWLILGLGGGIVAAFVVHSFEYALQEQLVLAAFIPAIVYMADAVGAQTQTIFIRSLALERALDIPKYVWREVKVTFALAILLGAMTSVIALTWLNSPALAAVLGIAIGLTIIAAMMVALIMPWMFQKLRYDPAIASGPFATVIRDIMSLLIYFGTVSILL